jgi:hypothetical protein
VLSVAGLYKTGKSSLLNYLLFNGNGGFDVGKNVSLCTKGLWCWSKPI